jgi:hypothetical protein
MWVIINGYRGICHKCWGRIEIEKGEGKLLNTMPDYDLIDISAENIHCPKCGQLLGVLLLNTKAGK